MHDVPRALVALNGIPQNFMFKSKPFFPVFVMDLDFSDWLVAGRLAEKSTHGCLASMLLKLGRNLRQKPHC